jgi:hypothetical protein
MNTNVGQGLAKITPGGESGDAVRFVEHAKSVAAQAGGDRKEIVGRLRSLLFQDSPDLVIQNGAAVFA